MTTTAVVMLLLGLLLGLAAGVALGGIVRRSRRTEQLVAHHFEALAARALRDNNETFLAVAQARLERTSDAHQAELARRTTQVDELVRPLREALVKVEGQLGALEKARLESYARLNEQVANVHRTSEQLNTETRALVTALRAPQARGRWGEMQLRRVVELAGMVAHCDFEEQLSVRDDDGTLHRPDLVVRIAGGKNVVVDSKVSLAAYLDAAETADDDHRAERMRAHARHLRAHVDDLAGKAYWSRFSPTPEFVVLFVPGEAFLAPALDLDPTLLDHAMSRQVIIATPTTLMGLLRTVAYAWQQDALTDNAKAVFDLGRELYERLGTLGDHVDKLGRSLGGAVRDYNAAVGSLETRVLVSARRLKDLKVVDAPLGSPTPLESTVRPLSAAELLDDGPAGLIEVIDERYGVEVPGLVADPHQAGGGAASR
jgi:DNA anti-recombination protein RmuC